MLLYQLKVLFQVGEREKFLFFYFFLKTKGQPTLKKISDLALKGSEQLKLKFIRIQMQLRNFAISKLT